MKFKNLLYSAVFAAIIMSSCSSDDSTEKNSTGRHQRILTITQNEVESTSQSKSKIKLIEGEWGSGNSQSADGPRKSVLIDQGEAGLNATWEMGDKMTVYNKSYPSAGYAVVEATSTTKNTTFVGTVDCEEGDIIRLFYPAVAENSSVTDPNNTGTLTLDISSQNGTLEDIQQHYDFNYGQATVTGVTSTTATANAGSTENLMAICKFTFKCDNKYLKQIKKVVISGVAPSATYTLGARSNPTLTPNATATVTINNDGLDNCIYVALFPGATTPTFIVYTNNGTYEGTLSTATLAGGKFYNVTVTSTFINSNPYSDDYVKVCGVKWARGNLQYDPINGGDEGFMENWRIAPTQWNYVGYDKTDVYDPSSELIKDNFWFYVLKNEAFNYATSYNFSHSNDISGKMYYSDNETKNKEYATRGDLAYWASNGKYKLPQPSDINFLIDFASRQYGYINENGIQIYGYLFTDPENERIINTTPKLFSIDEINNGLFLPCASKVTAHRYTPGGQNVGQKSYTITFDPLSGEGFYCSSLVKSHSSGTLSTSTSIYGIHLNSTKVENYVPHFSRQCVNSGAGTPENYYYHALKIRPVLCE